MWGVSAATSKYACLVRQLVAIAVAGVPGFQFTSICLNHAFACRPHIDKNNVGPSYIVSVGEHSGGELWVEDGIGPASFVLGETLSAAYPSGGTFRGSTHDIHQKWTAYDGRRMHYTLPFSGERYSFVFFCAPRWARVSDVARDTLDELGFPLPHAATTEELALEGLSRTSGSGSFRSPIAHESSSSSSSSREGPAQSTTSVAGSARSVGVLPEIVQFQGTQDSRPRLGSDSTVGSGQVCPIATLVPAMRSSGCSRAFSRLLRHTAEDEGVTVRPDGFVSVAAALKTKRLRGRKIKVADVEELVSNCPKQRFELATIAGEKCIRAVQGHSMKSVKDAEFARSLMLSDPDLPSVCVHSTFRRHLDSILSEGLLVGGLSKTKKRNHVHFMPHAPDVARGKRTPSGMREGCEIAIWIDLKKAVAAGVPFFVSKNEVVLTPGVLGCLSHEFIVKVEDLRTGEDLLKDRELVLSPFSEETVARIGSMIKGVYFRQNPDMLDEVDHLLEKYAGKEWEMYERVCAKYGEQPQAFDSKPGHGHLPKPQFPPVPPNQRPPPSPNPPKSSLRKRRRREEPRLGAEEPQPPQQKKPRPSCAVHRRSPVLPGPDPRGLAAPRRPGPHRLAAFRRCLASRRHQWAGPRHRLAPRRRRRSSPRSGQRRGRLLRMPEERAAAGWT